MQNCQVWIRLKLPEDEFRSIKKTFPDVRFLTGDNGQGKAAESDAVFTDDALPDELVARMPKLRWMHVTRGGVNIYLTPSVMRRPIQITGSRGIHGRSFTEFAIACIFALAKKLPQCLDLQRQKKWERINTDDVAGKTLGIVGLGTIGSELAQKAKALGLRVIATKRTVEAKPDYVDELGGPDYLPQMLPQVDFLVLCLASVPSTSGIIGEKELRSMKQSAYLINLTGGKVIDEKILARALKEKWIAGAAVDAFARQPLPPDSALWDSPNVMITARIAGAAAQKWDLVLPIFADNLRRFLAGEGLRNVVDKERGY